MLHTCIINFCCNCWEYLLCTSGHRTKSQLKEHATSLYHASWPRIKVCSWPSWVFPKELGKFCNHNWLLIRMAFPELIQSILIGHQEQQIINHKDLYLCTWIKTWPGVGSHWANQTCMHLFGGYIVLKANWRSTPHLSQDHASWLRIQGMYLVAGIPPESPQLGEFCNHP